MTPADRKDFALTMTQLFAIYGDELTDALLDGWWTMLEQYPLEQVQEAMRLHASDPDKGRFRPVPADIIRHLTVTIPEQRRRERTLRIRAAREEVAPLESELYQLQRALEFGEIDEANRATTQARINGLRANIGARLREVEVDDRPRLSRQSPDHGPQQLGAAIPRQLQHDADS